MKTPGDLRSSRITLIWIAMILLIPSNSFSPAAAQEAAAPASSKQSTSKREAAPAKTPLTPEEQKRADLLSDTEKLNRLTQELKVEVAKSNKDTLSVSVVKKAQEIERLAKSIKERSRTPR